MALVDLIRPLIFTDKLDLGQDSLKVTGIVAEGNRIQAEQTVKVIQHSLVDMQEADLEVLLEELFLDHNLMGKQHLFVEIHFLQQQLPQQFQHSRVLNQKLQLL